ncbi:D-alanine--D-alanine ligase family protein [Kocuria sp.]|uniref:D-alanine--D-alanine ligase family protein n=1 Tax=Kocuria sp. TaxID=1871328 RepID=UPI0026DC8737|nr:D-alanine--D-alanine ligase family protein [Kocuria sp.]MDO4918521.1 D-alanine--D-alanine ligase family protein [Kocuria sp.]
MSVTDENSVPTAEGTKPCVAVVFGGRSSEHSVSLITARSVLRAIDREKWDVVSVGISRAGAWFLYSQEELEALLDAHPMAELPPGEHRVSLPLRAGENRLLIHDSGEHGAPVTRGRHVDVVFPLLHGPFGEDGTLQGMLELAGLPYVGCGVAASAIGMDKHFMKLAFQAAGLEVGPYTVVHDRTWRTDPQGVRERVAQLGYPVFVKPARAGSSFGITRVDDPSGLDAAVETAREHDLKLVVEAGIEGREIECAVLGGHGTDPARASLPGEIEVQGHAFYDFEAKYMDDDAARLSCPARLPEDVIETLRADAVRAFDSVDGEGLSRCDFFVTPDHRVVINEINTMPGFTPISMYPRMWSATGLEYAELIDELVSLALERPVGLR